MQVKIWLLDISASDMERIGVALYVFPYTW